MPKQVKKQRGQDCLSKIMTIKQILHKELAQKVALKKKKKEKRVKESAANNSLYFPRTYLADLTEVKAIKCVIWCVCDFFNFSC